MKNLKKLKSILIYSVFSYELGSSSKQLGIIWIYRNIRDLEAKGQALKYGYCTEVELGWLLLGLPGVTHLIICSKYCTEESLLDLTVRKASGTLPLLATNPEHLISPILRDVHIFENASNNTYFVCLTSSWANLAFEAHNLNLKQMATWIKGINAIIITCPAAWEYSWYTDAHYHNYPSIEDKMKNH